MRADVTSRRDRHFADLRAPDVAERARPTQRSSCSRSARSSSTARTCRSAPTCVDRRRAWPTPPCRRVGDELDVWLLPPLAYTKSNEHAWSPGTIWLSADDAARACSTTSAAASRRRRPGELVFLNGHGGNSALLNVANRELRLRHGLMTFLAHPGVPPDQGGPSAGRRARHGRPRRHRRDVADAAPRARPRRHVARRAATCPSTLAANRYVALRRHGSASAGCRTTSAPTAYIGDPTGADRRARRGAVRGRGRRRSPRRCVEIAAFDSAALTQSSPRRPAHRRRAAVGADRGARRDRGRSTARTASAAAPAWRSPTPTATAATSSSAGCATSASTSTIDAIGNVVATRAGHATRTPRR